MTSSFSEISDFHGVCVVEPFLTSSLSGQIILEGREGFNEVIYQNHLRQITLSRLNLPEDIQTRDPYLICLITVKGKALHMYFNTVCH